MLRVYFVALSFCFVPFTIATMQGRPSYTPRNAILSQKTLAFHAGEEIDTSKYIDALPVPAYTKVSQGTSELTVTLQQSKNNFYSQFPDSPVFTFNGVYPGPIIEVESGHPLKIKWKNNLPRKHILDSDDTMLGSEMDNTSGPLPDVRAVTHMHGAVVRSNHPSDRFHNNDGWPDFWTVPGQTQIAEYPNTESARMLWFHDHAMGTTARNVYSGLFGMYIIRDNFERSLKLPSGKYEIPLLLESKGFNNDGTLYYPRKITAEVYGSTIPVNGKVWPYLNVEPRKYRFRVLNASNARTIAITLVNAKDQSTGPVFYQIGSDGGFLKQTVKLNKISLMPAERADVIIDFSKSAGKTLTLMNKAAIEDGDAQIPVPEIMLFKVGTKLSSPDLSHTPDTIKTIVKYDPTKVAQTRKIVLSEVDLPNTAPLLKINNRMWDDVIEEKPILGTTEVWEIVNTLIDSHPFHMHLVQFQVLDRRMFDVDHYLQTHEIKYLAPAVAPPKNEQGWKDTVAATPGNITRIIMKFGPYTGNYVYHCHILEHEDMGMMRPFQVVAPPTLNR